MGKGFGDVQKIVFEYVERWPDGCYRAHIYAWVERKGHSKPAIARAIKTLQGRGLIAMKGHGQFAKCVLTLAGADHAGKN